MVAGYVWDYAAGMQLLRRFFDAAIALDPGMRAHDEGVRFPITHEGRLAAAFEAAGLVDVNQRPIDVPTVFRDFDDLWTPFMRGTGPGARVCCRARRAGPDGAPRQASGVVARGARRLDPPHRPRLGGAGPPARRPLRQSTAARPSGTNGPAGHANEAYDGGYRRGARRVGK